MRDGMIQNDTSSFKGLWFSNLPCLHTPDSNRCCYIRMGCIPSGLYSEIWRVGLGVE